MKKTFFLFFMLFFSTFCFSQSARDISPKFNAFSDTKMSFEQFLPILEIYRENPANFIATFSPNIKIIDAAVDDKIYKYDGIEEKLRLYFSTSVSAVRENTEADLLEFIENV